MVLKLILKSSDILKNLRAHYLWFNKMDNLDIGIKYGDIYFGISYIHKSGKNNWCGF